ncbi:Protein NRT1/ PTR FAMILY 5.4 [Striga hermonthica]|uniref:Protein NRT1/ PTR FAMILY 5.4 n=1 Tax=Striga hermonthica TaxID=68872 RepID=A0A9N7R1T5_STRHE|nr:Protein NRT1/ PTR FAMILY 5.4 [Striga hermonthica]
MADELQISNSPSTGGWKSAIFIIFVEVGERFAYYGVSGNLFMYLTKVLGQPTATAAKNVNTWQGVSAMFPVVGGFLADSYVGRYRTILIASVTYLVGLILLTASVVAVPEHLRQTVFFISLYVLSVGEGGHKPCVQTFAADQFEEREKSSFFNWWYVGIVAGATLAVLVVIYVEDYVGWGLGFGILAAVVAAALLLFLAGSGTYRRQAPVGSPLTRVAQVVVAAARKRRLPEGCGVFEDGSESSDRLLARTIHFRFLDKASWIDEKDESSNRRDPWRLCTATQVEEAKLVFQLIPIWLSCLMFAVVIAQLGTYFTKQGTSMKRSITRTFELPPASFQVFTGFTILTCVLLYERAFVPFARRLTGHPSGITILQRIGAGLALSALTMAVAACVESRRVAAANESGLLDSPRSVVPMAAWWLLPQYVLLGVSDVFAVVGMQELFYEQMPVGMRSIGAAAYVTVTGVGSFLSTALIAVVQGISGHGWLGDNINRARVNDFYWLLAGMSVLNLCGYVFVARRFVYSNRRINGLHQTKV